MYTPSLVPKSQETKYVIVVVFGDDYIQYFVVNNTELYNNILSVNYAKTNTVCNLVMINGVQHIVLDSVESVDLDEALLSLDEMFTAYVSQECNVTADDFLTNLKDHLVEELPKELLEGIYNYSTDGIFSPYSIGIMGVIPNV